MLRALWHPSHACYNMKKKIQNEQDEIVSFQYPILMMNRCKCLINGISVGLSTLSNIIPSNWNHVVWVCNHKYKIFESWKLNHQQNCVSSKNFIHYKRIIYWRYNIESFIPTGYEDGDGKFTVEDFLFYESGPQKSLKDLTQSPLLVIISGLDQVSISFV